MKDFLDDLLELIGDLLAITMVVGIPVVLIACAIKWILF